MAQRSVLKSIEKEEHEEEENGRNLKKNFSGISRVAQEIFFYSARKTFCEKNG